MKALRIAARGMLAAAAPAALGLVLLGAHLGWGEAPRSWLETTGWTAAAGSPPGAPAPSADLELDPAGPPARLTWLGHAGFLLEWRGVRLAFDPNLAPNCTVAPRRLPAAPPAALGRIDAALVSHGHYDHLDLPTLAALDLARIVVPAGSEEYAASLAGRGVEIDGLALGETLRLGPLTVAAVPAAHNGNRLHPFAGPHPAVGYVVASADAALYFAGDTAWGPHFAEIGATWHPRVAILPIGAYSPSFPMKYYHLSPEEAVAAAQALGVERLVPAHFATFTLSLDRPEAALPRLTRAAAAARVAWTMPALWTAGPPPAPAPASPALAAR